MTVEDLQWGLMMMLVGMGAVFLLLIILMAVLMLIERLNRQPGSPADEGEPDAFVPALERAENQPALPTVHLVTDGLDEDQVAAITVAVITHAETRRRKAAPETRVHAPGSQLFASRWLSVGRALQNNPFTRR